MILTHPSIDPVIFSLGFLEIRWYGAAYVLAFILGTIIIKFLNNKISSNLSNKMIDDFFVWAIFGVILGGRIGYVIFYQFETFIANPIYLFLIWKGGMSFHGGLAGIIITMLLFAKKNEIDFFQLSDLVSLVAPIGLFFGRVANFINVELYGRITDFPFAMIYPSIDKFPRHPSQIYEAFFEGIFLFLFLIIISKKFFFKKKFGIISGLFLIYYGFVRFIIEFLREPDAQLGLLFNYLSMGQILSIPVIVFGILIYKKVK